MPTTKQCGTPTPANDKIGGVPTMHYLDFQSRGRGQVVRLLWEDASIAYVDVRYDFSEYPSFKTTRIAEMNPTATIPVVELGGKILTQSYAMLRHFARQLGEYEGETEEEMFWADRICDITIDWRTLFVQAFLSPDKDTEYPKHMEGDRKNFLRALETHLSANELAQRGPYVIGDRITYADLVLYQICHDENLTQDGRKGLQQYPRLAKLVDAVEARPNVKAFMSSDRYKG
ncbi:glutathione S-transferase-like protein [Saccharata proteae CBS 121410]|uniref:Glutathione S-transferase-like protein n=1 Tax=Saccharata proteae CBS 121410 TaxID=1314787 RepID=A0A6A5YD99_9PEZI|nr:glutathione S-transferase-like protein [Saccharata proteae CBS 121410]